ncbi:competence type IV pilus assembly protein ComGB [Niallia sp. Krafla_26]|uniref:competence type IV pilus assembly protein ComGB n=1 Tax=Niallia sp. Krafla_26 TaxID=3064703 RepID=UPI003D185BD7
MKSKWSLLEQSNLLKMTGELLLRGYPLAEALESVIFHLPNHRRREIKEVLVTLKEGYPFYQILQKLRFDKHVIGYVFFAGQHGSLAIAFIESSKMIQNRANDLLKLKKLLSYPLFLVGTTILLFVFVQKYLLPRFSTLFSSMNLEVNVFIKLLHYVEHFLPFIFVLFLLLIGVYVFYYLYRFRKLSPLEQKNILMKIPFISTYLRLFYTHYFSAQLSYLLAGGLSVYEALTMFENHEEQPFYQQLGEVVKGNLRRGDKLEKILLQYSFFEKELATIVKHGQENGKLPEELMFFASQCLQRLEDKTEKLMKQLQPILYSFIGILIVSMYLAVLLPMFQLLDGI